MYLVTKGQVGTFILTSIQPSCLCFHLRWFFVLFSSLGLFWVVFVCFFFQRGEHKRECTSSISCFILKIHGVLEMGISEDFVT